MTRDVFGRQAAFDPAFTVGDPPLDPPDPPPGRCAFGCGRPAEGSIGALGVVQVCVWLAGPLWCGCKVGFADELVADHRTGRVTCRAHSGSARTST